MAGSDSGSTTSSGFSFLQIPGNIKQQFLPFVLLPSARLHHVATSSCDLKEGDVGPQYFTYKSIKSAHKGGSATLRFYPSSMENLAVNNDISYRLLYADATSKKSLTIQDVLNSIPGVQIREFLPDTRLDQCINFFKDLMDNMTDLFKDEDSSNKKKKTDSKQGQQASGENKDEPGIMAKIWTTAKYTIKYMVGGAKPDLYDDIGTIKGLPFDSYKPEIYETFTMGTPKVSPGYFVMTFPYTLYYRLQSCMTTNIYEIPASDSNKSILESNGEAGWTGGGDDILGSGGFRVSKLLNKIPMIGSLANMVLGNIGINYMPWWTAEEGTKTKAPVINIKFDLFNDSASAAMSNFIFVNTIVPNNMWIQYNMF